MTTQQFLITSIVVLLILFGALGIERYRQCQERGGLFCEPGPTIVK